MSSAVRRDCSDESSLVTAKIIPLMDVQSPSCNFPTHMELPDHNVMRRAPTKNAKGRQSVFPRKGSTPWKLEVSRKTSSIFLTDETFMNATRVPDVPKDWQMYVCPDASLVDMKELLKTYELPHGSQLRRVVIHATRLFSSEEDTQYTIFTDIQQICTRLRLEVAYFLIPISNKYGQIRMNAYDKVNYQILRYSNNAIVIGPLEGKYVSTPNFGGGGQMYQHKFTIYWLMRNPGCDNGGLYPLQSSVFSFMVMIDCL